MIEIVMDKERNLKNLKQIGTPKEEDKIYVENLAYTKIKEGSYKEKSVFVLMGHSERMDGRYMTFVEAAIPVKDVEFVGNVPRWSNTMWSEVFREIRRLYEDMIIVGWAIDIKGMTPRMTMELERMHREHFGGVHQVLFLLDSLEQEETFYVYKENKIVSKDGFYIYYHARPKTTQDTPRETAYEEPRVQVELNVEKPKSPSRGQYRQMLQESAQPKKSDSGNIGLAIAVAMLVFVIGVGAYENRDKLFGKPESIETNNMQDDGSTETGSTEITSTETTGGDDIIIEIISGTEER